MTPEDVALACKDWTTEQVEQAIQQLALQRAKMKPAVPMDFAHGQLFTGTDGPRWHTQREVPAGKSLLHFRHPGFGWLHFAVPPDEAKRLAKYLLKQVEVTEKENAKLTNN